MRSLTVAQLVTLLSAPDVDQSLPVVIEGCDCVGSAIGISFHPREPEFLPPFPEPLTEVAIRRTLDGNVFEKVTVRIGI